MADIVIRLAFAALLGLGMGVGAQPLPDPTRPPSAMTDTVVAGVDDAGMTGDSVPRLQSVLLREGHRPQALIDGEWRKLGQKLGDAKVVRIAIDRVELRSPQGKEILKLTPEVEKLPASGERTARKSQRTSE